MGCVSICRSARNDFGCHLSATPTQAHHCSLQIFFTGTARGWGVRSLEPIPSGRYLRGECGQVLAPPCPRASKSLLPWCRLVAATSPLPCVAADPIARCVLCFLQLCVPVHRRAFARWRGRGQAPGERPISAVSRRPLAANCQLSCDKARPQGRRIGGLHRRRSRWRCGAVLESLVRAQSAGQCFLEIP